ncbi:HAD family hydrolase [Paenibacillus tarimensis]|uniref:HAD family hydrolase n=1 Tax=Paenibacillus tarimensis TaxID=416012 RepID=UPI001F212491|nr:HAD family hydrolase [Paenibacillus tarimensis]MCF2944859.1 HAD family hydrolase [Paenibacillus tarimensis]
MNQPNANHKAVFFDLDDTLYDQLIPFHNAAERYVPGELLAKVPASDLFRTMRKHSDALWEPYLRGELPLDVMRVQRIQKAFAEFDIHLEEEACSKIQDEYLAEQGRIKLLPGIADCLTELKQSGWTIGVITNGPAEHQRRKAAALQIDWFIPEEHIFISGAVGIAKPDARIFEHANRVTGTQPENSIYIGDSWANDVVGARAAGWQCIWYNKRGAEPGEGQMPEVTVTTFEGLASRLYGLAAEREEALPEGRMKQK